MMYFLILIFFVKILIILNYLYLPDDSKLPRANKKLGKRCHTSLICMIGGFIFISFMFFPYQRNFTYHMFIDDMYWDIYMNWESITDEFLLGYFITLVIIFLFRTSNNFKR